MAVQHVRIESASSRSDFLALSAEPLGDDTGASYEGPDVVVEMVCGGLRATAVLPANIADAERLASLFREIDRDWRGWSGEKAADIPDRDWLSFSARHDGKGHVSLIVRLAEGWPVAATWTVSAKIDIDAGSAGEIAEKLDRWAAAVWPSEQRLRVPPP